MSALKVNLIWTFILFILVFLVNYLLVYKYEYTNIKKEKNKKKRKKLEDFLGFSYLIPRFSLDVKKMNLEFTFFYLSLINAFIIAFVFMVLLFVPWDIGFSLLLGFVLLFGLIFSLYEIFGRILVKKGWSKNE